MSFDSLGLSPALLRALTDQGYTEPTPIQAAAIPTVLAGRDILAGAQTGTGKTAAFALPLIERLFTSDVAPNGKRKPRALILTPTRELAAQVHESVRTYGKHLRIFSTAIFGGVSMGPQMDALRRGVDIIVATPGRLMDHMERRTVDLSGIEILVLDEADRMLDMGFMPAIQQILGTLPKKRQTLLFSATFADEIKKLAGQFMRDPAGNSSRRAQRHRRHDHASRASGRRRQEARRAVSSARRRQPPSGARLQPHETRRGQAGDVPGEIRHCALLRFTATRVRARARVH